MMTKEGATKIVNFMTPGLGVLVLGRGHISHIVKLYYFFKNILLYSQAQIRQTKYIVMMPKEGRTKIVYFICIIVNMYYLLLYQYISHCYCVNLISFTIVDLFIILGLLLCQYMLQTRSQCKVSVTQVTIKACGPLVLKN